MTLMDPKVDFVFKRIFGSEKNKNLLISFLNSVFDGRYDLIQEIDLKNTDNEKDGVEHKFSRLDIKAITDRGEIINIEIQRSDRKDMVQRSLYYASKMIQEQLDGKEDVGNNKKTYKNYRKMQRVVAINIVNFNCTDSEHFHSFSNLTSNEGHQLTDLIEIHFLELPKFATQIKAGENLLECWMEFLDKKESQNLTEKKEIFPELKQATVELNRLSLDQSERELYEKRLETLRDEEALLQQAEEKGVEKGKEIGKEIGKEELLTNQILRALKRGRDKAFIMDEYQCSEEIFQKSFLLLNKI